MPIRHTVLAICFVYCSALPGADRYQRWIEQEVAWIASREEIEQFRQLTDEEEKEAFIDRFWRRRDPTPSTAPNEYKEEHYRRLEYANQNFREGVAGWRTDRGRLYIVHGTPDQVEHVVPDRIGDPETIIWTYFQLPAARYARGRMLIMFQASIGTTVQDVQLGESRQGRENALQNYRRGGLPMTSLVRNAVRYRLVAAGPPGAINNRGLDVPAAGIGDYARYVEDLLRSPGELLEERDREGQRQLASRKELREQIRTRVSYTRLPVSMSAQDFYAGNEALVSLSWQIPLSGIAFQEDGEQFRGKLDLMAQILSTSGELVDEFFKSIDLAYSRREWDGRSEMEYHYLNHFAVPPGEYRVTSVVRDVHSGNLGTTGSEVECRALEEGEIALSGLVLSSRLAPAEEASTGQELVHQEWKIVPEADGRFSSSDQLVLFFKIYNAQPSEDGGPNVVVTYNFFLGDQLVKTSGPRHLRQYGAGADASTIVYSSVVDLASFEPGEYVIQVNAIDFHTRKFAFQRKDFRIAAPSSDEESE